MKKPKLMSVIIIIFVLVAGIIYYNKNISSKPKEGLPSGKLAHSFETLDDIVSFSELIVEAKATSEQNSLSYGGVKFVKTKILIKEVLKGDKSLSNRQITLLQTKLEQDPIIDKNDHVVLFLHKYEGPIIDDAYVCAGLYQGHYKIKDNNLVIQSIDNALSAVVKDITKYNFNDLTNKIKEKSKNKDK